MEIYVLKSGRERWEELAEAKEWKGYFAEAVDDELHRRGGPPLSCLISFIQGKITHVGTLVPGNRAAEGRRRINVSEVKELIEPLRTAELIEHAGAGQQSALQTVLRSGGLVDGDLAMTLLGAIRQVDPRLADEIDRLERNRRGVRNLPPREKAALAIEKEMIGTALSFARIGRSELLGWRLPDEDGASFLDGLPQVRMREDQMVMNDMQVVPGFEHIRPISKSAALFKDGDIRLTVVLANHLALEEQLGADLIYYNQTWRAFTIVQYKAMEKGDMSTALFRLPNAKLSEELGRMRRHLEQLRACPPNTACHGYRLLENPFFLKLCPRIDLDPADTGLVKGMYLPLDYWDLIEADSEKVGPRGGRQVTFDNVGRYFDNTSFIPLVANGWIGTNASQSAMLEPIIKEIVASGRPLTVAVRTGPKKPPGPASYVYQPNRGHEQELAKVYVRNS